MSRSMMVRFGFPQHAKHSSSELLRVEQDAGFPFFASSSIGFGGLGLSGSVFSPDGSLKESGLPSAYVYGFIPPASPIGSLSTYRPEAGP
jgi:hypothetical protein